MDNPTSPKCHCGRMLLTEVSKAAGRCIRCRHLDLDDEESQESRRLSEGDQGQGADRLERHDAEEEDPQVAAIARQLKGHRGTNQGASHGQLCHLVGTVLRLAAKP